ncbi:HNH endonuclease [bacterium]|nr:HNH endonuclease [bacterium]
MLSTNVLVLNRSFVPVSLTTVKRAFCLLFREVAKAVDEEYKTFDFESWAELSVAAHHEKVGLVDKVIRVPRVVVLTAYDRLPKRTIRFSRLNIILRDKHTCQYCGKLFKKNLLNIDHVIPRSQGGLSTWDNVVCSCHPCNRKKGGRTPEQAIMKLLKKPQKPRHSPFFDISVKRIFHEEWKPFLNIVDFSYWNAELEE